MTYERVREQARVQLHSREAGRILHEVIEPVEPGKGLCRLPDPSPGDVFLDLEGDPFAGDGGREYLFGIVTIEEDGQPQYAGFWAETAAEERAAFEQVVTRIMEAWTRHPGMHVYHYAPYEPSAFKRLSCRYATRTQDIDRLLRAGRFVDLYAAVRQGVRAGVETYSIKSLEPLYDFARSVPLVDANRSLRILEQALELGSLAAVPPEARATVEGYNADDCLSTLRLREWLETLRRTLLARSVDVPRPAVEEGEASEALTEREQRVEALRARLLEGVPEDSAERTPAQRARWKLAYLIDWHRREDKASWWDYFRLVEMPEEELFDEPAALAGLTPGGRIHEIVSKKGKPTGSVIDRYVYPPQEMELHVGDDLKLTDGKAFGMVEAFDRVARTIDIRKGPSRRDTHPTAVFAHDRAPIEILEESVYRAAERVAGGTRDPLTDRLLLAEPPTLRTGPFVRQSGESAVDLAVRVVGDLDRSVLGIQGPPGAGKTFSGGEMICRLVADGKRVGVTGPSHKVILNLLEAAASAALKKRLSVSIARKVKDGEDIETDPGWLTSVTDNGDARGLLESGEANVVGGTAWLWARPEFAGSVDVLFIDEAGQMSMANTLAVAQAAGSIVLLGDPQQLEQPRKGSHPEGVNLSALEHMLAGHQTMPEDRGIFLPETWRLAPSISRFTSEVFYEGRLASKPGLEHQRLTGGPIEGSGLWHVDAQHDGNRNASDEEADIVADLVARLLAPGSMWVAERGRAVQMTAGDLRIVAPYNAHVSRLAERLAGLEVPIGTVDKFQGQEAPVVIYSMATSTPEEAPRGLEFLYSLNRLNVATSRARCAAILVASPHLYVPDCSTPRQMKLANALCRFREMARPLDMRAS